MQGGDSPGTCANMFVEDLRGEAVFKKVRVFRLKPGQELLSGIEGYCRERGIASGLILGIIGSVRGARLNYLVGLPGKYESVSYSGPLEIVCAQGSVALDGDTPIIHIHIQLSTQDGCHGGHLAEATVFSTAEVALGELDYQLRRAFEIETGLRELKD